MPYLLLRESYVYNNCVVDGLPHNELRLLAEKYKAAHEMRDERNRRVEFNTSAPNLLSSMEQLGYR